MIATQSEQKKRSIIDLGIAIVGIFCALLIIVWLNQHVLMRLPLSFRMVLLITSQWLMMIVPLFLMQIHHKKNTTFHGIRSKNLSPDSHWNRSCPPDVLSFFYCGPYSSWVQGNGREHKLHQGLAICL